MVPKRDLDKLLPTRGGQRGGGEERLREVERDVPLLLQPGVEDRHLKVERS